MQRRFILLSLAILSIVGCSSNAVDKDAKRSQDRTAMRLSEAEIQRDQYKSQVEKLQSQLDELRKGSDDSSQQLALLRKQVQELQGSNTSLNTQIEKLKIDLSRANVAKSSETK
jgi:peptidoglycan hydrolase CwlO-like protein